MYGFSKRVCGVLVCSSKAKVGLFWCCRLRGSLPFVRFCLLVSFAFDVLEKEAERLASLPCLIKSVCLPVGIP